MSIKGLLVLIIFWRLILFTVAFIGGLSFKFTPSFPYSEALLQDSLLPSWVWSFANFDGVHYLTIAKSGYSAQFTQVFFPLYPLAINILHRLMYFVHPILIGITLSSVAFFLSLIIFIKLLRQDYNKKIIVWTIFFLVLSPVSFFFGSLYTESVFFLFILLSFYFGRQRNWLLAGIFGAMASLTRLVGILLFPALLWEIWNAYGVNKKKISPGSAFLLLIPAGLGIYSLYLYIAFKDALYFWHAQGVFGAERSGNSIIFLPQVLWRYVKIFVTVPPSQHIFWISLFEFCVTIVALFLLFLGYKKKIRMSYLIFGALAVIIPTLSGTLSSMPRYMVIVFPIFIALGMIKSTNVKIILLVLSAILLAISTVVFTRGNWLS